MGRVMEDLQQDAIPPVPVHRVLCREHGRAERLRDAGAVMKVAAAILGPGPAQHARDDRDLVGRRADDRLDVDALTVAEPALWSSARPGRARAGGRGWPRPLPRAAPAVGTRHRNQQAIGTFVCKFGRRTGRTCGRIQSKDHDPDGWDWNPFDGTYIRVDGGSTNTSEPGDSGSPFFVEDLAYGIATHELKEDDNDTLYMSINYASDLGVSVLTSNPGICNLVPTASFTAGARFDGTANFNGSTSSDPDGTVVRWEWDFGDGTTGVSTTPYITRVYPPDSGSYYVTLTVTDNEGKRASASKEVCVPTISCTDRPVQ